MGGRRNLELKARDPDPSASLERCRTLDAVDGGSLDQVDTYFAAREGRLKLRETDSRSAELIAYARADVAEMRPSDYRIVPVSDLEALRELLAAALGVVGTVRKRRRLFLWHGVRIHLDEIAGLGAFVELEGVVAEGRTESEMAARVGRARDHLGIAAERLVRDGYLDLVLDAESRSIL